MNVIEFANWLHMSLQPELRVETSNPELASQKVPVLLNQCNTTTVPPTITLTVLDPNGGIEQRFTLAVYEGVPSEN